MIDVLRGLEHAHSQGILHRDIKPANILIGPTLEGKLSDFGLAVPVGLNLKALGAKEYVYALHRAPEVHQGKPHTKASDIYACGVTLYRLVNGDSFFSPPAPDELEELTVQGRFPDRSRYRDFVPLSFRRVINRALSIDPSDRFPSAAHMRRALEQVTIEKNWSEKILANGLQWTCGWRNKCYEVTRVQGSDEKWTVTVKKGSSKKVLRRVARLCQDGLSRTEAEQRSRRVLQDFVLGKLK